MIDWIALSQTLVAAHSKDGEAFVTLGPVEEGLTHVINITRDPLVVKGRVLKPRQDVRQWLFTQKRCAAVMREGNSGVWSVYVDQADHSIMGLAIFVTEARAMRWLERNPDTFRMMKRSDAA